MRKTIVHIGILALLAVPAMAWGASKSTLENWTPLPHDRLVVDVEHNWGYLMHWNGTSVSFPVATGQRRTVHYIGRTYNAATPQRTWVVQEESIKGDHITFGKTGRFLRLFKEGQSTPYGIHGHASADTMLSSDDRFRSMGCIIVSEEVLDILEKTFAISGESLPVYTTSAMNAGIGVPQA